MAIAGPHTNTHTHYKFDARIFWSFDNDIFKWIIICRLAFNTASFGLVWLSFSILISYRLFIFNIFHKDFYCAVWKKEHVLPVCFWYLLNKLDFFFLHRSQNFLKLNSCSTIRCCFFFFFSRENSSRVVGTHSNTASNKHMNFHCDQVSGCFQSSPNEQIAKPSKITWWNISNESK